jgi:S-adenosylmethionine-diacylglycerol 3-amino-3-carboxypropyl transferase
MRSLTYEEYLFFMGYRGALQSGPDFGDSRMEIFSSLKLSKFCRQYWEDRRTGWEPRGFILLGRWENHFQKLGFLFREILQCDFEEVFAAQSLSEQIELYEKYWPKVRWNVFIKLAASEFVFNKFLYKGHFSGRSDHKTEQRGPSQFIMEEFDRIFRTQLVRKNYFMQTLFLGRIVYEEGLPLEAHQHIFDAVKKSKTEVNYLLGNLLDYLPKQTYDFVSLSDTISYLTAKDANQILQKMNPANPTGTCVVIRSFMRAPQQIDLRGWKSMTEENEWAQGTDGTGVYQFHIFAKK